MIFATKMTLFHRNLFAFVTVIYFALCIIAGSDVEDEIKALPDCTTKDASLDSYVFVSTIDGRLSALDANDGGEEVWNISTGPGPMLSSSIHSCELAKDGRWQRMIPSLSGGLYQFSGENVEVVPFTADDLLQSSFRFKDDIVLTGGKESRTYGLDAKTGSVLYECSLKGCDNFTADTDDVKDVLILQRLTHTVRAVEPRTSFERWNFSVARHNVKLAPDPAALCHNSKRSHPVDYDIQVIVPEGLVCGISRSDPGKVLWKHKFDSPVVSAWTVDRGEMKELDLFSGSQWRQHGAHTHDNQVPLSPSLYIGMHKKQLYIQESVQMQQQLGDSGRRQNLITHGSSYSRIPWLPVPAVPGNTLGLIEYVNGDSEVPQITDESYQAVKTTAMSVLYASEYVNGNGFFLYSSGDLKKSRRVQCGLIEGNDSIEEENSTVEDQIQEPDTQHPRKPQTSASADGEYIFINSLWYWWKEVLLISITTAILVNLMLPQGALQIIRLRRPLEPSTEEGRLLPLVHSPLPGFQVLPLEIAQEERPATPNFSDYTSKYLQEFQPVQCLGKGGFGVVFEARKKFDDCHYAVKRIPLTNKGDSLDRVLREVRALAKLDHNNIVRYFNSWFEHPPPGWQEQQDKKWTSMPLSSGSIYSQPIGDQTNYSENSSISLYPDKKLGKERGRRQVSVNKCSQPAFLNLRNDTLFEKSGSELKDDVSDSYIVFEASGGASSGNESDGEEEDSERKESVISVCSTSATSSLSESSLSRIKEKSSMNTQQTNMSLGSNCVSAETSISYLFIQMQLCRKDSLKDWLRSTPCREYSIVMNFFEQIVMAVEYVHLNNLIHRDLKPSNIFFSMDGHIKIGDFGLVTTMLEGAEEQRAAFDSSGSSNSLGEKHTAQVGTELYMSPEQRMGRPYNYKVDIYSLGLILFELIVPFGTEMERLHVMQDLRHLKFPRDFTTRYVQEHELLKMMLDHQPEKRPTTLGIRARAPLRNRLSEDTIADLSEEHHFELPTRQRSSSSFTKLSTSSSSSFDVIPGN